MEIMVMINYSNCYCGKRIFITGHTGFKGSWLTYVLYKMGAIIKGYSLPPVTSPSLYNEIEFSISIDSVIADINDYSTLEKEILAFQPDYIFHLAAQPLVRQSYSDPLNTFSTNIIGTANILNVLTKLKKTCISIIVTTDKVYENYEWSFSYKETDRLGGFDPYSASKACAELVIQSYVQSFFNLSKFEFHQKAIVSVRAGNVIGGGDWSDDRLIPDIVKSIAENKNIIIRNPDSVRPWQHVLEPIFGYLKLGDALKNDPKKYCGAWNFGPSENDNLSVITMTKQAIDIFGKGNIELLTRTDQLHEAGTLKLDINKAINELGWKPRMDVISSIQRTINWYQLFYEQKKSAVELIEADLKYYQRL